MFLAFEVQSPGAGQGSPLYLWLRVNYMRSVNGHRCFGLLARTLRTTWIDLHGSVSCGVISRILGWFLATLSSTAPSDASMAHCLVEIRGATLVHMHHVGSEVP